VPDFPVDLAVSKGNDIVGEKGVEGRCDFVHILVFLVIL
jgi:hypothetical protein